MSDQSAWDDQSRSDLRETLKSSILGHLRLAKRDRQSILQTCREVYIQDDVPPGEVEEFVEFAAAEYDRTAARLAEEQSAWPAETDSDRLDRVEAPLRERGIVLWQASPSCDTCTSAELGDRVNALDDRYPGFAGQVRGYAFFIDQNMPENLSEGTKLGLYLGYGWFVPEGPEVPPETYEQNELAIAREVCQSLSQEGFEHDWNGDFSRKIRISLNWQRRTSLE